MPLTAYISEVNKTILQNGLTVLSEKIPAYRSIAVGIWIKTGSRFESSEQKGIVHFIEHMLFKGTKKRSALEIAQSLERYGGQLNAFTGKEETCFYIHTIDTHLEQGLEVLADMIFNPLFSQNDIDLEKQVVLEEINSVYDIPEEYIFDVFQDKLYPHQPMGYPILGDPNSVKSFEKSHIYKFWQDHYHPSNMVLAVAGNVDHVKLTELAYIYFDSYKTKTQLKMQEANAFRSFNFIGHKPLNQAHICLGNEAVSYSDENRYDFMAISFYLGGGLSSKLFQVLREELGYVYSIYSFLDFYKDTGVMGFYLGTDLNNKDKAVVRLFDELDDLLKQPLSEEIVILLKEQLKGKFFLTQESTFKRMTRLAKNELQFGTYFDDNTVIQFIEKITTQSLYNISCKFLKPDEFSKVILIPENN